MNDKLPLLRNDRLIFEDTSTSPMPGSIAPCLLCTKPYLVRSYIGVIDQVCPECYTVYKDAARVVCWKCRVVICRLVPKILDNGFYLRPKTVYHADACNICKPGLKESKLIEVDEWEKHIKPKKIILTGK